MRKFTVISLAVSGKNNKIFRTHDEVLERQVQDADDLVLRGHLKEITNPIVESPSQETESPTLTVGETSLTESTDLVDELIESPVVVVEPDKPGMAQIETADIKKQLKERGVIFNKNASKEELYRLFIGL